MSGNLSIIATGDDIEKANKFSSQTHTVNIFHKQLTTHTPFRPFCTQRLADEWLVQHCLSSKMPPGWNFERTTFGIASIRNESSPSWYSASCRAGWDMMPDRVYERTNLYLLSSRVRSLLDSIGVRPLRGML